MWNNLIEKRYCHLREVSDMAKDLVCGGNIDEKKAGASYNYQGQTYYFCGAQCKDKFAETPDQFINR